MTWETPASVSNTRVPPVHPHPLIPDTPSSPIVECSYRRQFQLFPPPFTAPRLGSRGMEEKGIRKLGNKGIQTRGTQTLSKEIINMPREIKRTPSTTYANILRNQASSYRVDTNTTRWRNHATQSQEPVHPPDSRSSAGGSHAVHASNVQLEKPHVLSHSTSSERHTASHRNLSSKKPFYSFTKRTGNNVGWQENHDFTSSPNSYYDEGYRYEGYWQDPRPAMPPDTTFIHQHIILLILNRDATIVASTTIIKGIVDSIIG
ncbi:hypothetical protein GWK47_008793 [Chionoecetes opilio]|uniref:Uncharacterized protein n=1 Tax=Chionoecetes opilio TaxID=41210 RepID=A0A8J4XZ36_CHIOP|nr:hypothetical protein GWK47_008793 [Chionoecetes opilio]